MLASIALFSYVGHLLDTYYLTSKPIFTALLAIIGIASGLYLVIKQVNEKPKK